MEKTTREIRFEEYREYLRQEVVRLASYVWIYRRLHERRADRLEEMNLAPTFFQFVIDALFSAIVLWVDNLFSEKSERGLLNFLVLCEYNRKIFGIKELQRRRNYPAKHWMLLNRDEISFQTIQDDRKQIKNLKSLRSFRLRRDKFHAHFDKKYFFNRKKLMEDAPLKWSDLNELVEKINTIIDRYSEAYDGRSFKPTPINITDIDRLLDRLHMSRHCHS